MISREIGIAPDEERAWNSRAWAIGRKSPWGFCVRKIVWGRMLARAEKREGEIIRRATIVVRLR